MFAKMYDGALAYQQIRKLKQQLLAPLYVHTTGVLLDPNYGINLTPPSAALILSLEKPGISMQDGYPQSELLDGWSTKKAKNAGAIGVKLLVNMDPDDADSAAAGRRLAEQVAHECLEQDILLLLEPMVPGDLDRRDERTIAALETLADVPADIFKIEYPGPSLVRRVSSMIEAPWAVLSGGVDFDQLRNIVQISGSAGCSGFVAGRSVWQEIKHFTSEDERAKFIQSTVTNRFEQLRQVAQDHCAPLWNRVTVDDDLSMDWYQAYALSGQE